MRKWLSLEYILCETEYNVNCLWRGYLVLHVSNYQILFWKWSVEITPAYYLLGDIIRLKYPLITINRWEYCCNLYLQLANLSKEINLAWIGGVYIHQSELDIHIISSQNDKSTIRITEGELYPQGAGMLKKNSNSGFPGWAWNHISCGEVFHSKLKWSPWTKMHFLHHYHICSQGSKLL